MKIYKRLSFLVWIILCALLGLNLVKIPQVRNFVYKNLGVKEVVIEGSDKINMGKVKEILADKIWFSLNEKDIQQEFKKEFSFIKSVKLEKPDFRKIRLIITEYKPFAYVSIKNKNFFITKEGIKLDKKYYPDLDTKNLLRIIINDEKIDKLKLEKLEKLNNKFCKKFAPEKYIIYKNQIACVLKNNKTFMFGLEDLDKNIKKAEKFLLEVKDIDKYTLLDFRFEHMVIAKEKNKDGEE